MIDRQGEKGVVFDIKRLSTDDGPGCRSTVFLKGCPLSCVWCHSPESISGEPQLAFYENRCIRCGRCSTVCPEDAHIVSEKERRIKWKKCANYGKCVEVCPSMALKMLGEWMTVEQVVGEIKKDVVYYRNSGGGVTLSGGEPAVQPSFSLAVLKKCKEENIHTAFDTSGFVRWSVLSKIIPYVDLFLYDIKCLDSKKHLDFTNVSNEIILKNLEKLEQNNKEVFVRIPVIPGYNDYEENIYQTAKFVKSLGIRKIFLLPFNEAAGSKYTVIGRSYKLDKVKPLPREKMEDIAKDIATSYGLEVQIEG